MTTPLVPCPECARHVRAGETCCPFCRAPLDLAGTGEPLVPVERLGRVSSLGFQALARAGLVAAASSALVACDFGTVTPVYGAPGEPPAGGSSGVSGAGPGGGSGHGGTSGVGGTGGRAGTGGTAGTGAAETGGTSSVAGEGGAAGVSEGGAAGVSEGGSDDR